MGEDDRGERARIRAALAERARAGVGERDVDRIAERWRAVVANLLRDRARDAAPHDGVDELGTAARVAVAGADAERDVRLQKAAFPVSLGGDDSSVRVD